MSKSGVYAFNTLNGKNLSVENLTIYSAYIGIFNDGSSDVNYNNVTIISCGKNGFRGANNGDNILLINSHINCDYSPVSFESYSNVYLANNFFSANNKSPNVVAFTSMNRQNLSNFSIINNLIEDSTSAGISFNVSSNVNTSGNVFSNVISPIVVYAGYGVFNYAITNNIFQNINWLGNGGNAIRFDDFDTDTRLSDNNFSNILYNAGNGRLILFQGGSLNRRISRNRIENVTSSEYIGFDSIENYNPDAPNVNATVENNVITCFNNHQNSTKGIVIYGTSNSNFKYNVVSNCQFGMLWTNDTINNFATGNNISQCASGWVFQEGARNNLVVGDYINASRNQALLVSFNNITTITPYNNTWKNVIVRSMGGSSEIGAYFTTAGKGNVVSTPNYIVDSVIDVPYFAVNAQSNNSGGVLINVTYLNGTVESSSDGGAFKREWWYQTQISDSSNNAPVANVTVSVYNFFNETILNLITDEYGMTSVSPLLEYAFNGTRIYSAPYRREIFSTDYNGGFLEFNLSSQNFFDVVQLDIIKNNNGGGNSNENSGNTGINNGGGSGGAVENFYSSDKPLSLEKLNYNNLSTSKNTSQENNSLSKPKEKNSSVNQFSFVNLFLFSTIALFGFFIFYAVFGKRSNRNKV